jgi:hypothetical protein
LFHPKLSTKLGNIAAHVPNFDRIDLHITEVGEVVSEQARTLIRCHADASRNGLNLLHSQMLRLFLFWRMTVRIMHASHLKGSVRRTIKQFDLTLTSEAIGHGAVTPFHTCPAMVDSVFGFQFPEADIGWSGHMAVQSDHSCIFYNLVASLSDLQFHLILSHSRVSWLHQRPSNDA